MFKNSNISLVFLFFFKFAAGWDFPHYLQCDPSWGNDLMGVTGPGERATICEEGCAMSDIAMALYALNVTVPGNDSDIATNPGSLNWWLENNDGYECIDGDCNNLVLPIIDKISNNMLIYQNISKLNMFEACRSLDAQDTILVAHNSSIPHFVLSVNCDWNWNVNNNNDTMINVLDPYFNATQYSYNKDINYFLVYGIYNKARSYPYYPQCDSTWADQIMGGDNDTICQVGCLMTSVSMAIAGYNIPIDGQVSTPETLNVWLQNNNGYVPGTSDLIEDSLNNLPQNRVVWPIDGMHTTNDISIETIRAYVQDKPRRVAIANVMQGEHFVLVVDVLNDMDTLLVNDPGQFHNYYSYSKDVVGWRLFDLA